MPAYPKDESDKAAKWFLKQEARSAGMKTGYLKRQAAEKFGVSVPTINRALKRRTKE